MKELDIFNVLKCMVLPITQSTQSIKDSFQGFNRMVEEANEKDIDRNTIIQILNELELAVDDYMSLTPDELNPESNRGRMLISQIGIRLLPYSGITGIAFNQAEITGQMIKTLRDQILKLSEDPGQGNAIDREGFIVDM